MLFFSLFFLLPSTFFFGLRESPGNILDCLLTRCRFFSVPSSILCLRLITIMLGGLGMTTDEAIDASTPATASAISSKANRKPS